VFGLVSFALSDVHGGVSIVDLVIDAVLLWYFLRPHVKSAFKISGSFRPD
jgi:hypothetical protein